MTLFIQVTQTDFSWNSVVFPRFYSESCNSMMCDSSKFAILDGFYVQPVNVNPLRNQSVSVFIRSAPISDIQVIGPIFVWAPESYGRRRRRKSGLFYLNSDLILGRLMKFLLPTRSRVKSLRMPSYNWSANRFKSVFFFDLQYPWLFDNNLLRFCTVSFYRLTTLARNRRIVFNLDPNSPL